MEYGVSATNFTFFNFPTSTPVDSDFHFLEPKQSSSVLYDQYPPQFYSLHHQIYRKETENLSQSPPGIQEHFPEFTSTPSVQPESLQLGDRLMIAIEYLKEYVEDSEILFQIWMPMKKGGQNVLTTIDQPYSLNPNCRSLASYRNVSESFHLTTEEDSKESAGLPGRVFSAKIPEWTPDVRFFRNDECPRKNYAKIYNISGCLALPVFDHQNICLAVVEIVTTSQKISYHLEIEIVCKALEAVDLRSCQDFFPFSLKAYNEIHQLAVPEISETLQSICQTYRLPLAQTWTLHDCQFDTGSQQFPAKFDYCISTVNSACYVADDDMLGFHEACSEQCLFLDQGIVGKAFATNKQWFATDITSFSKTNYPLSHHARMFDLGAAVAIPLRNMYTGLVQFVLEIFLPRVCKEIEQKKQMWELLPVVIQQACPSFRVVMDKEFDDKVNELRVSASWEFLKEEPEDEFNIITQWDHNDLDLYQKQVYSDFEQIDQKSVVHHFSRAAKKRQNKIEKTISLQVLRQYFAGSLKDAAKSIGVCPTTLKRICRQHGINRWPSRKIKKVNHSLRKLQLVVNSIHGTEGLIQIDSFYKTFPGLNSAEVPQKDPFLSLKKNDKSNRMNLLNPKATYAKSQSYSSSQNSGSSISCSAEAKKLNNNESSIEREEQKIVEERFQIQKTSEMNHQSCQTEPEFPKNASGLRVKASFGQEHIRFSFLQHWSLKDLKQEIAKRFKIDDFSRINLKYTDTDNEPVLLTCDADLEECIDLLRFSSQTIKISLHQQQIRPVLMPN